MIALALTAALIIQTYDGQTRVDLWGYWPESEHWERSTDAFWNTDEAEWQVGQYHAGQFVQRPRFVAWMPLPDPPALLPPEVDWGAPQGDEAW